MLYQINEDVCFIVREFNKFNWEIFVLPPKYTAIPMMPKMPKITNTIDIPSNTPHKLRLNFLLCSRFKLFWADHKEYELVVWWPLRWPPSGGYFFEVVDWSDLFDLIEAEVNACLGTVPPGWGTFAKLLRDANEMASSRSLSSKPSLWND